MAFVMKTKTTISEPSSGSVTSDPTSTPIPRYSHAKATMATAACHGWATPPRSSKATNAATAATVARAIEATIREMATLAGPSPANARRRSAPRDDAASKKPRAPDRKAAAQPADRATAASPASEPPNALAKSWSVPAAETTNRTGTTINSTSVNGARNCSRVKVRARVTAVGSCRLGVRRRGRGVRARPTGG